MPVTTDDPRRRLGALGEQMARDHLSRAGYLVVESNYRTRRGELDIVAADARALVFCEVKTRITNSRSGPGDPLDAIGPAKRRRIRSLAREWLHERRGSGIPQRSELRFDAIGITVDPRGALLRLEHVEDAF